MIRENYLFLNYLIIFIFLSLYFINLFNQVEIFSESSPSPSDKKYLLQNSSNIYFYTIPISPSVNNIELDSNNGLIYAVYDGGIYIINGSTNEKTASITIKGHILKIAIDPEKNRIYVANAKLIDKKTYFIVSLVDSNTKKVIDETILPNEFRFTDMTIDGKTNILYLSDYADGNLYSLNYKNINPIINVTRIPNISSLDVNPTNHKIYSILSKTGNVSVIEPDLTYKNISVARIPDDLFINPKTNLIYVINNDGNRISVIDGQTDKVIKTISLSLEDKFNTFAKSLAIDSNSDLIYLTSYKSIFIIDDKINKLLLEIPIGAGRLEVDINQNKDLIYVTDKNEGVIHFFNGILDKIEKASQSITKNKTYSSETKNFGINVIPSPKEITVDQKTGKIYTIDDSSGKIVVIDEKTENILDQLYVVNSPSKLAVNSKNNIIFVLDDNKVYSLDGNTKLIKNQPLLVSNSSKEPIDITINEQKNMLYITYSSINPFKSILYVIDSKDSKIIDSIPFSGGGNVVVDVKDGTIYLQEKNKIIILNQLQNGKISKNRDNIFINGIIDFDFDSINKNLHIISDNKTYYIIDIYTGNITKKSLIYEPSKIAIDPLNNRGYILNFPFDSVTLINNLVNPNVTNINLDIPFTESFDSLDINPKTNKIFITSAESGIIYVLDENSNKLTTGITYSINPPDLGFIECNGEKINAISFKKYDKDSTIQCKAKPNNGALFTSWSGDFKITTPSDRTLKVNAEQYGNITANFKEVPVTINFKIPFDTLLQILLIIITAIIGWLIPSIINTINNFRYRKIRKQYLQNINDANNQAELKSVFDTILTAFHQGNLNSLTYDYLNEIIKNKAERL